MYLQMPAANLCLAWVRMGRRSLQGFSHRHSCTKHPYLLLLLDVRMKIISLLCLICNPTTVSYILRKGRSKKEGGGSWRDILWRRTCTRLNWEVFQSKAHMSKVLQIHLLVWLIGRKHLVRCWSPLMLLQNRTAKKRLRNTDLWGPSYRIEQSRWDLEDKWSQTQQGAL